MLVGRLGGVVERWVVAGLAGWLLAGTLAANAGAQAVVQPIVADAAQRQLVKRGSAVVAGTVVDTDGGALPGAKVMLNVDGVTQQTVIADEAGRFRLEQVSTGQFTLVVTAEHFSLATLKDYVDPGQVLDLDEIKLKPGEDFEVTAVTEHEAAEIELKHEEGQRLLGVLPNFAVSYDWHAPPMSAGEKSRLIQRLTFDPVNLALLFGQAGLEQETGEFSGFGPGVAGYWKRFGAASGDFIIGNELGGAVFPIVMHQDPRYFWKGSGTVVQRTWYAINRAVICRGDDGQDQFCYSSMSGDLAASAISNVYYPASDRHGVRLTLENGGIAIGFDAMANVIQEFFLKRFTPKSKDIPSTAP